MFVVKKLCEDSFIHEVWHGFRCNNQWSEPNDHISISVYSSRELAQKMADDLNYFSECCEVVEIEIKEFRLV